MVLDEDKRELAKVAQKEPAAFGRIKQKALDLGMSTEEFILSHDSSPPKQENSTETNELQESIKELSRQVQEIKSQPQQQPIQQQPAPTPQATRGCRSFSPPPEAPCEASITAPRDKERAASDRIT